MRSTCTPRARARFPHTYRKIKSRNCLVAQTLRAVLAGRAATSHSLPKHFRLPPSRVFLDRLEDYEVRDLERAVEFHLLGNQAGRLNENSFNIFRFEICAGSDSCIESGGARHGFEPVTAADAF